MQNLKVRAPVNFGKNRENREKIAQKSVFASSDHVVQSIVLILRRFCLLYKNFVRAKFERRSSKRLGGVLSQDFRKNGILVDPLP